MQSHRPAQALHLGRMQQRLICTIGRAELLDLGVEVVEIGLVISGQLVLKLRQLCLRTFNQFICPRFLFGVTQFFSNLKRQRDATRVV